MMQPDTIALETRGAIDILTLNRPAQRNAVTPEMIEELTDYFSALDGRPTTRVVILRGNGSEFSAGAELGSDAFATPGKGRPQRQLKMQQNYSGVIRLMRLPMVEPAEQASPCYWHAMFALLRPMRE